MFSKVYSSRHPFRHPFWKENGTIPFNELILSWNGLRPKRGKWTFFVSLDENEWLPYAEWGAESQRSFKSIARFAQSYQDVVTTKSLCTSFLVKVEGEDLSTLHSLTVCLSHIEQHAVVPFRPLSPLLLPHFQGQSQMLLAHPRRKDFCSPTSTANALNYLLGEEKIDPLVFAARSRDEGFDIHGNWVLNIAEAYNQTQIPCHVERLADFSALYAHLLKGNPVVVSVKGTLAGAPLPYPNGHLLCVIGCDTHHVHCVDPAFPDDASTFVSYKMEDFLSVWGARKNLSYVFTS